MLEEYQKWAHSVVIELIEADTNHFKELLGIFRTDEAVMDVGF